MAGNADFDITECLSGSMEQGITARKHTSTGWPNLLWRSSGKGRDSKYRFKLSKQAAEQRTGSSGDSIQQWEPPHSR